MEVANKFIHSFVTFHGIHGFPRDSFVVNISMHFWATVDVVWLGCQGDLVSPVRGGAGRALYEERLLHAVCAVISVISDVKV